MHARGLEKRRCQASPLSPAFRRCGSLHELASLSTIVPTNKWNGHSSSNKCLVGTAKRILQHLKPNANDLSKHPTKALHFREKVMAQTSSAIKACKAKKSILALPSRRPHKQRRSVWKGPAPEVSAKQTPPTGTAPASLCGRSAWSSKRHHESHAATFTSTADEWTALGRALGTGFGTFTGCWAQRSSFYSC